MTLLVPLDESKVPLSVPSFVRRAEDDATQTASSSSMSGGGGDPGQRGSLASVVAALLKARRIAVVCGE